MLLEGVRTLDEAVDEVRDDRRQKEQNRLRKREHDKLERAHLKAINRQHRSLGRGRGSRQVEAAGSPPAVGAAKAVSEPAIPEPGQLPLRSRPSLQAVTSPDSDRATTGTDAVTVDLTAEDDTQTLPRLDSLEQKLKDLEQQFG